MPGSERAEHQQGEKFADHERAVGRADERVERNS
jgi:hypothetical protein